MVDNLKHADIPWTADKNASLMPQQLGVNCRIKDTELFRDQARDLGADSRENMGLLRRALSAAGAAVISSVLVNPFDVVKTRLQAQAAGVGCSHPLSNIAKRMTFFGPHMMFADLRCSPSCTRAGVHGTISMCPPDCFHYKGSYDVFRKIIRQEGFSVLWRGTNAGLATAVPTIGIYLPLYDIFLSHLEDFSTQHAPKFTPYSPLIAGALSRSVAGVTCYPIELARTRMQAFKHVHADQKPPGIWKTLIDDISHPKITNRYFNYRSLWTGLSAQLARDVPFSAICWSTLEPIRRQLLGLVEDKENNLGSVLGTNFAAGFLAGSFAAAATCPLDVARTRRQIEKDPSRAWRMTTRQTLLDVWRDGGMKGLFTGVGPRVARGGPSMGIIVSFYEVVKYALNYR